MVFLQAINEHPKEFLPPFRCPRVLLVLPYECLVPLASQRPRLFLRERQTLATAAHSDSVDEPLNAGYPFRLARLGLV